MYLKYCKQHFVTHYRHLRDINENDIYHYIFLNLKHLNYERCSILLYTF